MGNWRRPHATHRFGLDLDIGIIVRDYPNTNNYPVLVEGSEEVLGEGGPFQITAGDLFTVVNDLLDEYHTGTQTVLEPPRYDHFHVDIDPEDDVQGNPE